MNPIFSGLMPSLFWNHTSFWKEVPPFFTHSSTQTWDDNIARFFFRSEQMRKGLIGFASAIFIAGLAGCAGNMDDNAADNRNGNFQTQRVRTNLVNDNNNNDQNFRVADRASRSVERLDEVDQARVIISNNNAYVAVRLKDKNARSGNNTDTRAGTFYIRDNQDNRRTGNGRNNGNTGTGAESGRITGVGNNTNNGTNAGNHPRTGTGSANNGYTHNTGTGAETGRITGVGNNTNNGTNAGNEPRTGTSIYNNGMAGQGSTIYSEVSTAFEQKIADQVRAADKNIHKVYVSFSEDTYNTINNYSNDIQNGRNQNGIFENFDDEVRRMFGR